MVKSDGGFMLKTLLRPAMIVVPLFIGFFIPAAGGLAYAPYNVVRISLFFMIFMASLGIRVSDLRPCRGHWYLLAANILLGVIPFCVAKYIFAAERDLALALFFIGITPTAAASSVIISLLNGRVGFGLTGFAISNVGISLALLFLLPFTTGNFTADFCFSVAGTILTVIAVPIALAQCCRRFFPQILQYVPKLKMLSLSLWSTSLFIMGALARQYFIAHPGESLRQTVIYASIALLFCILNFYLGAKIAPHRFRRESSQLLGQKNTIFTIHLALNYASPLVALALTFYIAWHNSYNAIQLYAYDRRRKARSRK